MIATARKADLMPIYPVHANADSGEWNGEPEATEEFSTRVGWDARTDTDTAHFEKDDIGRLSIDSETRLIRVVWA